MIVTPKLVCFELIDLGFGTMLKSSKFNKSYIDQEIDADIHFTPEGGVEKINEVYLGNEKIYPTS